MIGQEPQFKLDTLTLHRTDVPFFFALIDTDIASQLKKCLK